MPRARLEDPPKKKGTRKAGRRTRAKLNDKPAGYWTAPVRNLFTSGCTLLDCILGGGWILGRVINIIGDKSTGKTLLAIEASANFLKKMRRKGGRVRYCEVEAAFDDTYASGLGLDMRKVDFPPDIETVESLFADLQETCAKSSRTGEPILYIVDSLDALSDEAEMASNMDEGTYGTGKAKKMSQLFRRLIRDIKKSNVTLIVISQVRENIGVTFGKKTTRSGGRALNFYASQMVELAHLGRLDKTRKGIKRAIGIKVKAQCTKSKVGPPFRTCEFPIIFDFGVEDVQANIEFLKEIKRLGSFLELGEKETQAKAAGRYLRGVNELSNEDYFEDMRFLRKVTRREWKEIEDSFHTPRRKYSA